MISVLYVDDEPDLLDLTKMFLERMGNIWYNQLIIRLIYHCVKNNNIHLFPMEHLSVCLWI